MTQPRIENAQNIVRAAKCCYAQKILDINARRRKTFKKEGLERMYDEAFWLNFYIKAIEFPGLRGRLGNVSTSRIMDRLSQLCEC